jgi:hypothetical protein
MKNIKHPVIELLVYFLVTKGRKSGSKPAISQLNIEDVIDLITL